jgi:hypothetical protein
LNELGLKSVRTRRISCNCFGWLLSINSVDNPFSFSHFPHLCGVARRAPRAICRRSRCPLPFRRRCSSR